MNRYRMLEIFWKFIGYSFKEISKHEELTEEEREFLTEKEFNWIKAQLKIGEDIKDE